MVIGYTTSGSKTVSADRVRKLLIQVNAALTGNIIVTAGGVTIATITNPTVGSQYLFMNPAGPITVNPSTTCDISVSTE